MPKHTITPTLGWEDVFIVPTQDGSNTLFHRVLQVHYHSVFGAVGESKHVFLLQGLMTQINRPNVSVLEFGFGTGLNAFLAYLISIRIEKAISYIGIEEFPLDLKVIEKLDYPSYLAFPEEKDVFFQMHSQPSFTEEQFQFKKISSIAELKVSQKFDCIFFDAFDPVTSPEQWEPSVFLKLYNLTSPGGCLVTYCAQGEVRRNMISAGYVVERLTGPPGKREMLRAVREA